MNNLISSLIFLLLAVCGVVIKKTYSVVPASELKRRAEKKDKTAIRLYKAVSYGESLQAGLWIFIALTSAASLVLMTKQLNFWLSLVVIAVVLWLIFSLIPATRVSSLGLKFTLLLTPLIAKLLYYTHPVLSRAGSKVEDHFAQTHTGLFERSDLVALIERQGKQNDSRFSSEELDIVLHALKFDEKPVSKILTPRKKVKTVLAGDTIGPILINELHESAQEYVLVKESSKGKVVGTLAFKDLGLNSRGHVKDTMDETLYYLHEQDSLSEALHAFFVTNHSLFVVVNSFEEYVGIVTIEAVLKELLGHVPGDDFEEYTDVVAVAARHNKAEESEEEPKKDAQGETPVKTDE